MDDNANRDDSQRRENPTPAVEYWVRSEMHQLICEVVNADVNRVRARAALLREIESAGWMGLPGSEYRE